MVQDKVKSMSESENFQEKAFMERENTAVGVASGKYMLVGWAIDTTGRRLIDEICQIAAYTPVSQFSQYIMPFSDIPFTYGQTHNIRISNVGRYRILKYSKSNKIIKTKSDITALTNFVEWLEKINEKEDCPDGIILIYHEFYKWTPPMLIEILRKHLLLDRFTKVVKGFANSFALCSSKCATTTKSFGLHVMTSVLLGLDNVDLSSAVDRAQACYNVVAHLSAGEREELVVDTKAGGEIQPSGSIDAGNGNVPRGILGPTDSLLVEMIRAYTNPLAVEEDEIKVFKVLLERQNTFKPVFSAHLRASIKERQRASRLRRILAVNNIDLAMMKEAWEKNGCDEMTTVIKSGVPDITEQDLSELLVIFDSFFDPDKKQVLPKKQFFDNNNRHFRTGNYRSKARGKSESEKTSGDAELSSNSQETNEDSVKRETEENDNKKDVDQGKNVKLESTKIVVESEAAEGPSNA